MNTKFLAQQPSTTDLSDIQRRTKLLIYQWALNSLTEKYIQDSVG